MDRFKIIFTSSKDSKSLAWSMIIICLLTMIHHIYGGILYSTPWRIIMVCGYFFPMLGLSLFLQYKIIEQNKKWVKRIFVIQVFVVWTYLICIQEGGYNHLVKVMVHYMGISEEIVSKMFPSTLGDTAFFEKPNDFIFESTGIVQVPFAFIITYYKIRFLKGFKLKKQYP